MALSQKLSTQKMNADLSQPARDMLAQVSQISNYCRSLILPSSRKIEFSPELLAKIAQWASNINHYTILALLLAHLDGKPRQQEMLYQHCRSLVLVVDDGNISAVMMVLTAIEHNILLKTAVINDFMNARVSWADEISDSGELIAILRLLNGCPQQQNEIYQQCCRSINSIDQV